MVQSVTQGSPLTGKREPPPRDDGGPGAASSAVFYQVSSADFSKLPRDQQIRYLQDSLYTLDPQIALAALKRIPEDLRRSPSSPHLAVDLVPPLCFLVHCVVARGFESSHELFPLRGSVEFFLEDFKYRANRVADIIKLGEKHAPDDIRKAQQLIANYGLGKRGSAGQAEASNGERLEFFRKIFANTWPLVILRGNLESIGEVLTKVAPFDPRDSRIRQAYRYKLYATLRDSPPHLKQSLDLHIYPLGSVDPILTTPLVQAAAKGMLIRAKAGLAMRGEIHTPFYIRFKELVQRTGECFFPESSEFIDRERFKAIVTAPIAVNGILGKVERYHRSMLIASTTTLSSDAKRAIFESAEFGRALKEVLRIDQSLKGIWNHRLQAALSTCCAYGMSSSEAKLRITNEIEIHPNKLAQYGLRIQLALLTPEKPRRIRLDK